MGEHVRIFEMSPRDGLQNEARLIPTAEKIELVNRLSECGFDRIEVTSLSHRNGCRRWPDAAEVMAGITRKPASATRC